MRLIGACGAIVVAATLAVSAQQGLTASAGPYKIVKTAKVGGAGGFDYVYADVANRRLYIPRTGTPTQAHVMAYNLDTLEPAGEIAETNARGVAVDPKSNHAFASSKPVAMWDAKTLKTIKTIDVTGNPDGIMFDPFNGHVWVFSHSAPNATIINAADGAVVGTLDLGGAPEQAVTDGRGRIYVDLEDKDSIAVIDAKANTVTGKYGLAGQGGGCAGLALDTKNHVLFAACSDPQNMVMVSAEDGKLLGSVPIGQDSDGATFNPATGEAFSANCDGTLTVVKESSPTSFGVEQTVKTMRGGKTLTLDSKNNQILIIAAEYGPAPAAPAGGRAGRPPMIPDSFTILVVGK